MVQEKPRLFSLVSPETAFEHFRGVKQSESRTSAHVLFPWSVFISDESVSLIWH